MSKKIDPSRRSFLKNTAFAATALSLSPIDMLTNQIINGMIEQSIAEETGMDLNKYYIHLSLVGGPPRWHFDLPLKPNGNEDPFEEGKQLITKISDYSTLEAKYELFEYAKTHFPHLWGSMVPNSSGSLSPLTELLQHMIMFRGINLGADGHGQNRVKQVSPIASGYSLSGLAADDSNLPIPSVYLNSSLGYKSKTGVSAANVSSGNPIEKMLTPFLLDNGQSYTNDQIETFVDRAVNLLQKRAQQVDVKNKGLFNDRHRAKQLFKREFGNLASIFTSLRNKYERIIQQSLSQHNLVGVDGEPLISDGSFSFRLQSNLDNGQIYLREGADLRDSIVYQGQTMGMSNESTNNNNTTISNLATSLALAEYSITNNISNSITLGSIGSLSNLRLDTKDFGIQNNKISNNDAHATGAISTMFYFSKYYKALSACLLEFTNSLKNNTHNNKSYFDNTIIHLGGEFNRIARANGSGQDHGWQGSGTSIITGMTDKPHVIGNIKKSHSGRGAWGLAGHMQDLGNREMLIGNVASSITTLLGTESPTPNDSSLLGLQNGKVINYASKPKNV